MTPNEAADRTKPLAAIPIRQRDHRNASIEVARNACRGDPRLPIVAIQVRLQYAA